MKHLKYCFRTACQNENNFNHPQKTMEELGIKYQMAIAQSIGDQWWFFCCEEYPENLPSFLKEFATIEEDMMEYIGFGLSKEDAEKLNEYIKGKAMQNHHKFRAYDTAKEKMLSWEQIIKTNLLTAVLNPKNKRFIPMLNSGLKDLATPTGKEIHEGDIMRHFNGDKFVVEYHEGCFCANYGIFYNTIDIDRGLPRQIGERGLALVVGNMYESKIITTVEEDNA